MDLIILVTIKLLRKWFNEWYHLEGNKRKFPQKYLGESKGYYTHLYSRRTIPMGIYLNLRHHIQEY